LKRQKKSSGKRIRFFPFSFIFMAGSQEEIYI
jgi:hypothetical protein